MVIWLTNDIVTTKRFLFTCTNAHVTDEKALKNYLTTNNKDEKTFKSNTTVVIDTEQINKWNDSQVLKAIFFMKNVQNKFINTRFIYTYSENFLQHFLNFNNIKKPTTINVVRFISFIKKQLSTNIKTLKFLKDSDCKYLLIETAHVKKITPLQIKLHTQLNVNLSKNYPTPLLQHQLIKNWEQIFNQLYQTNFYKFLK